jgi:hypothetical protein
MLQCKHSFVYKVTVVINVLSSVRYKVINKSTSITQLILKQNTEQQTEETKRERRKQNRENKRRKIMKWRFLSTHDDRRPGFYNASEEDRKRNSSRRSSEDERSLPRLLDAQ